MLKDYPSPEPSIYAVYAARRHLLPKVRVLVDFLTERFVGD